MFSTSKYPNNWRGEPGEKMQTIKCVLVGDSGYEKYQLLKSYVTNISPSVNVPYHQFNNHAVTVMMGSEHYTLRLFDRNGQEDYDKLRPMDYPDTDVLLVFFSVVSPSSFKNVKERWMPEIRNFCPRTPFLLVGTETDLRDDVASIEELEKSGQSPITVEMGEEMAREIKAVKYLECSVLTKDGVKDVFDEAILAALKFLEQKKMKKKCVIS